MQKVHPCSVQYTQGFWYDQQLLQMLQCNIHLYCYYIRVFTIIT